MNRQTLGVIGSLALFVGVFTPIISLPMVGAQNLFQNGRGDGMILLPIAALSLLVTVTKRFRWLILFGLASLGLLAVEYLFIQSRISEMRVSMERELADNPFRGFGDAMLQAVQLQWGWAVLVAGAAALTVAGFLPGPRPVPVPQSILGGEDRTPAEDVEEPERETSPAVVAALILLALIGGGVFFVAQREKAVADREATAAREEAQRRQQQEETAKREAISQLRLDDFEWDSSEYSRRIVGRVINGSSRRFSMVKVEFSLEDRRGNLVGTASDYVSSLEPGESWRFSCFVSERGYLTARLRELSGTPD